MVMLKKTPKKELTLNNVVHTSNIQKNLVSGSLLSRKGFQMIII
jgi:hypothetical protein